ncbi:MAG TPA: hypothetical protein EYP56_03275 [Planctomycetaceae bacterium]|nr:hypothetical protein [Planctomycetaceae bacterium]
MDTLRWCLAFGPVAVYLMSLGAVNLLRRPVVVSGTREAAAMGLALSGLFIVGPLSLFFPVPASIRFGPAVWAFLITLYALSVILVVLLMRPRVVIYNISANQLRPVLTDVAMRLDRDARWAGESLALPSLGVQLYVESSPLMRNVVLGSVGRNQNHEGWQRLEAALRAELASLEVPRNRSGLVLLAAGALMAVLLASAVAHDPAAVAQSLSEMLRLQ